MSTAGSTFELFLGGRLAPGDWSMDLGLIVSMVVSEGILLRPVGSPPSLEPSTGGYDS